MDKYLGSLKPYGEVARDFNTAVIGLALNSLVDKVGNIGKECQYRTDLFLLRDSVLYRLSSLNWHIHNLCKQHSQYEKAFSVDPQNINLHYGNTFQSFLFDDFVFNLISLYDYFANLLGFLLIGENKKRIGWDGFAKSAMDRSNKFSKSIVATEISKHENEWVKRLSAYRAEVIHYNAQEGKGKMHISWKQGEQVEYSLQWAIPEKLAKKLKLTSPSHDDVGIDLQHGSIEIAERSIRWLLDTTNIVTTTYTSNQCQPIKKPNERLQPTAQKPRGG